MAKKPYSWRSTFVKFLGAALLLNVILVVMFATSTPTVSPASTWTTAAERAWYAVRPVTDRATLEQLHANSRSVPKEQCIACHGTMVSSKLRLHQIHLTSQLLPGLQCNDCHKSISLETRSNRYVVRMVDVSFCKKCHSAFPGLNPNSPMKPSDFKADCTTCHSGKAAVRHDAPYLSQVVAPKECPTCHGARILPWTPAHEQSNWLQAHGPEALKTGSRACMACHDYGLQFCDSCHKLKPPSHEPRDQWLNLHADQARADTRACFTCHRADYCKKCHVNHPAGWLQTHPAVVRANGVALCMKCHSRSWCSFCHADQGGTP